MDMLFNTGAKGNAAASDLIKEGTTAGFVADVIEASSQVPVIVDFWAPWCGPCKQLGPALEKLVKDAKGAVRMVKINVDQNQDLAAQMRVQSIPAVYAFKDGRPVDGFVGAVADSQIKSFVQRLLGDAAPGAGLDEALAEAKTFLAEGDAHTAMQIYQEILAQDPENQPAIAGMLRCQIALGDAAGAAELLTQLPPEMLKHPEIAAVRTALDLAEQAGQAAGAGAELRRRVADNPDDHQARFDLALAYYANNESEASVDELLELFRRNRAWNDEAARKQLVKMFEALGPAHPLSISGRRRLSSLLFS